MKRSAGVSNDRVGGRGAPSTHDRGELDGEDELATQLADLARSLESADDLEAMLAEIVRAAVEMVPGADEGSLSMVKGRRTITSQHPTGDLVVRVDALQNETGQGPCLDAVYEHETVRVQDFTDEPRWPLFAERAHALGAGSMLALQLYVKGDDLGAMNLVSRRADAFDDESEHIGLLFASHAAVALAGARHEDHLRQALINRDVIGQAKGILMERFKVTPEAAFLLLTRTSQSSNRKLHAVALDLVQTGDARDLQRPPQP